MTENSAEMDYTCPVCAAKSVVGSPSFPFCSKRCKLVDLGSWMDESYRISRSLELLDPDAFDLEPFVHGGEAAVNDTRHSHE